MKASDFLSRLISSQRFQLSPGAKNDGCVSVEAILKKQAADTLPS